MRRQIANALVGDGLSLVPRTYQPGMYQWRCADCEQVGTVTRGPNDPNVWSLIMDDHRRISPDCLNPISITQRRVEVAHE